MKESWRFLLAIELHLVDLVMTFMLSTPTYRYISLFSVEFNFRFLTEPNNAPQSTIGFVIYHLLFNADVDAFPSHSFIHSSQRFSWRQ